MTPMSKQKLKPAVASESAPAATASHFSRYVSFALLLGAALLLSVIFYKVMAHFVVPLFLSALLVVIFRPLHTFLLDKLKGRRELAALLTTLSILMLVLVPLAALTFLAISEGRDLVQQFSQGNFLRDVAHVREQLKLNMPAAREIRRIEDELFELQAVTELDGDRIEQQSSSLYEVRQNAWTIAEMEGLEGAVVESPVNDGDIEELPDSQQATEQLSTVPVLELEKSWTEFSGQLETAFQSHGKLEQSIRDLKRETTPEKAAEISDLKYRTAIEYQEHLAETAGSFKNFKYQLLGGRAWSLLVETVNPTQEKLQEYAQSAVTFAREKMFALGGSITAFLASLLVGTAIMIIGLYFFLLDGPAMLESLHVLSPIEDDHERELMDEFTRVSRAVVVATLLSAAVQGLFGGIGYWVCGLDSIFLLTLLTAVLAMVPFVGAAAVWIPCSLYLFFVEGNLIAAIGLAIYGVSVISMADNVIKPWILHGQSNLHPMLALLSVLGGVAVLGPIGILVGPMIVAFLQTLLKILQREMAILEQPPIPD